MCAWRFKRLLVQNGVVKLVELTPEQEEKLPDYEMALRVAADSRVSDPPFSNYHVLGSVRQEIYISAGNIEYGLCQALHCEETAVATLRSVRGKMRPDIFAFTSRTKEPSTPPTCCGNCRDILLDAFGRDFEFVQGHSNGQGIATISKMSDLLFDDYEISPHQLITDLSAWKMILRCRRIANDAYSPLNVFPERRYFACIGTANREYYGATDLMCDYHPIYPVRDAIRQARRRNDPFIKYATILRVDTDESLEPIPPHVMYKDRQHLLELNLQAELLQGEEQNPLVHLLTCRPSKKGCITGAWHTFVKEWLPFPFTARNFGEEFVKGLTEYYKSLE